MEITAYSVKEKATVPVQNPAVVTMKNGRKAVQGLSPAGNKVFRNPFQSRCRGARESTRLTSPTLNADYQRSSRRCKRAA